MLVNPDWLSRDKLTSRYGTRQQSLDPASLLQSTACPTNTTNKDPTSLRRFSRFQQRLALDRLHLIGLFMSVQSCRSSPKSQMLLLFSALCAVSSRSLSAFPPRILPCPLSSQLTATSITKPIALPSPETLLPALLPNSPPSSLPPAPLALSDLLRHLAATFTIPHPTPPPMMYRPPAQLQPLLSSPRIVAVSRAPCLLLLFLLPCPS